MGLWAFGEYAEPGGVAPFSIWLRDLETGPQAFVDNRLLKMAGLRQWPEKWASKFQGTEKLIELRIPYNKVQYRPLGIYSPWRRYSFVLLGGAIEKGRIRKEVIDTMLARQKRVEEHSRYVREYAL
jgi:hypothetical protein